MVTAVVRAARRRPRKTCPSCSRFCASGRICSHFRAVRPGDEVELLRVTVAHVAGDLRLRVYCAAGRGLVVDDFALDVDDVARRVTVAGSLHVAAQRRSVDEQRPADDC